MLEQLQSLLDGRGVPFVNGLYNLASDVSIAYYAIIFVASAGGAVLFLVGWMKYAKSKSANQSGGGNGFYLILSGLALTMTTTLIARTTVSILGRQSNVTPFDYLKEAETAGETNPFLAGLFALLVFVNLAGYAYFVKALIMVSRLDTESDKGTYSLKIFFTLIGAWTLIQIVNAANAVKISFMN